jgi:lipopolysaccharide/colanic/teichoic acid biosynthesis glycosyltransferase
LTTERTVPAETPAAVARPAAGGHAVYFALKRSLDLVLGALALLVAVPILVVTWVAMRAGGDRGPFLYRARRVGEGGRQIDVLKIRTMTDGAAGPALTSRDDPRVTGLGRVLRRYRLDELPQLWNVLKGEMTLVGPRPEDPRFVDLADPLHRRVFTARPGITGLTQLAFRDEAEARHGPDTDRVYRETVLPAKLQLDSDYLDRCSTRLDLAILVRTAGAIFGRGRQTEKG